MAKKGHLLPKSGINSELVSIQWVNPIGINEALTGEGGSQVAGRNFKMSRVGVLSRHHVALSLSEFLLMNDKRCVTAVHWHSFELSNT